MEKETLKEKFFRECTGKTNKMGVTEITYSAEHLFEWFEKHLKEEQSRTGLFDKNGKELTEGCKFEFTGHKGCTLKSFEGEVIWISECACFGYSISTDKCKRPFEKYHELQTDFLNHIEIIE